MGDQIPSYVPKLVHTGSSTATTYHFQRDPRGFGWALCSVNDQTGELLIMSDWGNWSHRWNVSPSSLGHPTLTHFLGERADCHYLANKLTTREERRVFDPQATVAALRKTLCERRLYVARCGLARPTRLTREVARGLWDEIGEIDTSDATLFCERFMQIDDNRLVSEEPWEDLEHAPSTSFMVLLHGILPALADACAGEVKRRTELANAPTASEAL